MEERRRLTFETQRSQVVVLPILTQFSPDCAVRSTVLGTVKAEAEAISEEPV